jgi:hypothetical protein
MELQSREIGVIQLELDGQGRRYPRILISEGSEREERQCCTSSLACGNNAEGTDWDVNVPRKAYVDEGLATGIDQRIAWKSIYVAC